MRPVFREVAPPEAYAPVRGFLEPLRQPQDRILAARGYDFTAYEEILRDDQVRATFQQRRLAVVSRELVVEAGGNRAIDRQAADFLREQIEALPFDDITDKMLYGTFFGWSVAELLWSRQGRWIGIDAVKVRKRQYFRIDLDGRLRLVTAASPQGQLLPERKFWWFQTGGDTDDDPYGLGLAPHLYWPVWFKRNGLKFWLIFLEKFGAPTALGKYPQSANDDEKTRLREALQAIQTEATIEVPEGFEVTLLKAARTGNATYREFIAAMDAAISKVVLSQTMTTDPGSSRAQAEVHMDVRQEVVKADSDLICGSFNGQVAKWLTEWNFPGARTPKIWRRVEDDPDLEAIARRDRIILELGYRPTETYIRETYGEGYEPVSPATQQQPPALSEGHACPHCGALAEAPSRDALDGLADDALDGWEPLIAPQMEAILRLVEDARSLDELGARLGELLPALENRAVVERLFRARLAARLAGETGAEIR